MSDEYTQRRQAEADFAEAERERRRTRNEALEEAARAIEADAAFKEHDIGWWRHCWRLVRALKEKRDS